MRRRFCPVVFGARVASQSTVAAAHWARDRGILTARSNAFKTLLDHHLCLDVLDDTGARVRNVRNVCTIGPATQSEDMIAKLIGAGMNVARLNCSHGSHEYHATTIRNVRAACRRFSQCHVGIALDTKGPEIRTGLFAVANGAARASATRQFHVGQSVTVTSDPRYRECMTPEMLFVDYEQLATDGSNIPARILIADGVLELEVRSRLSATELSCVVVCEATIGNRCNVHLPGAVVDLPAMSPQDVLDLDFAAQHDVDFVFASFARCSSHITSIRERLALNSCRAEIIAKIESQEGVRNLESILDASDGAMVARGDLALDIDMAKVFLAQKKIISRCNVEAKPAICATQMLESMRTNPRPTRAEVADVANAIIDGADSVMLSAETASGQFPVRAVEMLTDIGMSAHNYIRHEKRLTDMLEFDGTVAPLSAIASTAAAAVLLAHQNRAKAIITLTISGNSVRQLRKYSPYCPVVAVCVDAARARRLSLIRGVVALHFDSVEYSNFDRLVALAIEHLRTPKGHTSGLTLARGDHVIISCTDSSSNEQGMANSFEAFVRVHKC